MNIKAQIKKIIHELILCHDGHDAHDGLLPILRYCRMSLFYSPAPLENLIICSRLKGKENSVISVISVILFFAGFTKSLLHRRGVYGIFFKYYTKRLLYERVCFTSRSVSLTDR
jgi:hypothetical protein